MEKCDVLIVGAGPAGSACARHLRQGGLDVTIIDRQRFPRDKVCAGWITPAVVEALELDLAHYRAGGRVLQPINGFHAGIIDGNGVTADYHQTVSYGIRRSEFDHYLVERSGARLMQGESLLSLERIDDHWLVNGRIRTPMLIGAGGHFCPVARHLGAKVGDMKGVVAAQEAEFVLTDAMRSECAIDPGIPEIYFCRDLKGYGWALIKGGVLNIGLGREDRHQLARQLEGFVQFLKDQGRIPESIPRRFQGHAYLLYGQHEPRRVVDNGVLLVGDAAGLAYPQSGEGIRPAIESGLLAAEAVLDAGGDYRREQLLHYERAIESRFGRRRPELPKRRLPQALQQFVATRLLERPWFIRHVVLDRWFLHRHQPPLKPPRLGTAPASL